MSLEDDYEFGLRDGCSGGDDCTCLGCAIRLAEAEGTTYHPFGYGEFDSPSGVEHDCGYQDVECWVRQLRVAGWLPVSVRTGKEVVGSTTWRAPNGDLYRGPYKAWQAMKGFRHENAR